MLGIRRSAQFTPTIVDEGWIEPIEGYDRAVRYPTMQVGDVHYNPPCTCGEKDVCDRCVKIKCASRQPMNGLRQQRWLLG